MMGESMALHHRGPDHLPTREEVEARLSALSSRVLSRRKSDNTPAVPPPGGDRDPTGLADETIVRLRALEARLTLRGGDL